MREYLFVYGTLLPQHAPAEIAGTVRRLRRVGSGLLRGRLYDLGRYPGAIVDQKSHSRIHGEVFELPGDRKTLAALDAYEESAPGSHGSDFFVREMCPVTMPGGRRRDCWVYTYNGDLRSARFIVSGRYLGSNR